MNMTQSTVRGQRQSRSAGALLLLSFGLCVLYALLSAGAVRAQSQDAATLQVAVKEAPPFAIKKKNGEWEGLTVELWRKIAEETGLKFKLVESNLNPLIEGVASKKFDVGLGALTVTPERETRLDFTHGFYATGLSVATRPSGAPFWRVLGNLASGPFLYAVGLLFLVLLIVGVLFWIFERRRNAAQFGGNAAKGVGSGFWLAAVTMTTVGYGDKAPVSPAGRLIALLWMFIALIIISTFTGMIASSLTVNSLEGSVQGPDDLPKVTVGSISKTSSAQWLGERRIGYSGFRSVEDGLKAVADGAIDAFVYDAALLKYLVKEKYKDDAISVLPALFDRQSYAIALAPDSPHRETINVALLKVVASRYWKDRLQHWLGE